MKLTMKGEGAMYKKLEQETEIKEREKVLVPIRRREAEKEAELEIREEPPEQWQIPRRWYSS